MGDFKMFRKPVQVAALLLAGSATGEVVGQGAGSEVLFEASRFPQGVYFARAYSSGSVQTRSLLLHP